MSQHSDKITGLVTAARSAAAKLKTAADVLRSQVSSVRREVDANLVTDEDRGNLDELTQILDEMDEVHRDLTGHCDKMWSRVRDIREDRDQVRRQEREAAGQEPDRVREQGGQVQDEMHRDPDVPDQDL
jgi:hypothetical protein